MYTQYLVSLRVYNPEGSGPETIVVVMTDEGGKSLDTKLANTKDVYTKIWGPTLIVYLSVSLSANVENDWQNNRPLYVFSGTSYGSPSKDDGMTKGFFS